ncbi:MAG: UDP-N-acetylmuramoyl-L-alanyl-D-glutamate--2,6-diaminopimelate ligase [Phascolarctobacterium sp.]|nr:UDP-N-acetylmuramoyl-L-alanyl-D-glutamate--2,6-diaminopimelate ligase [Candidatus Phascolarctobacterium caballi]
MEKHFNELAELLVNKKIYGDENVVVTDITADSRKVVNGSLFIALRGTTVDGHTYVGKAIQSGATAILVDTLPDDLPNGIGVIVVPDTREAMEIITPYFFDYPGKKLRMIGVTGTNGKTTTTNIIYNVLREAGYGVGLIGTINIVINDTVETSHNTTPDVVDLQKTLYHMVQAGCDYCVMEVSSHALVLKRVAGIEFDCGVLTNITQDHLDFHKTMEAYRDAKSLLFEHLADGKKSNKAAIFNADDESSKVIEKRTKVNILTYGKEKNNDIYPICVNIEAKGMNLELATPGGNIRIHTHITGLFNVYNLMGAVAVLLVEGVSVSVIEKVLNEFKGVQGRFQLVEAGQNFTVIVDYGHTPDGLENVLRTARKITEKNLWVVFGCGGDRDNTKRPIMGKIALELADKIVVTSDNPRSENPETILDQICVAFQDVKEKEIYRFVDRKEAICFAMGKAESGDVVLIAGKGHENYQILKDKTIHFDDCEVVKEYWSKK